jgi:hypothetical protein
MAALMNGARAGEAAFRAIIEAGGLTKSLQAPAPPPLDETALRSRWERARRELTLAMRAGEIPSSEFPYEPALVVFAERLIQSWPTLDTEAETAALLALAALFEANYGASLLACAMWKHALIARGALGQAERVSLREQAIIALERERSDADDLAGAAPIRA